MKNGLLLSITKLSTGWEMKSIISAILAMFSTYITKNITPVFVVFFILYIVDFATGIAKAISKNQFASSGLWKGFGKWFGYSVIVGILLLLKNLQKDPVTGMMWKWICDWTLFYLMFQEYSSICENLEIFGVKLPSLTMLSKFTKNIKESVNGK